MFQHPRRRDMESNLSALGLKSPPQPRQQQQRGRLSVVGQESEFVLEAPRSEWRTRFREVEKRPRTGPAGSVDTQLSGPLGGRPGWRDEALRVGAMLAVRVTPGLAERGAMVSHALGPEGPPPCQPYSRYQALMGCQVAPRDAGSRDSRGSRRPHDPRQSHVHRRLPSPPDRRHGGNDGQQRDGHRQPNGAPPPAGLKALGVPGVPWPPSGVASGDRRSGDLPGGGSSVPPCQPQPQRQGSADSPWVVREERLQEAATIIRAFVLAYLTRRRFLRLRASAVRIQRRFRAVRRRREHARLRLAPATPPAGTRRARLVGAGHHSPLPPARRGSPDAAAPVWVHRDAAAVTDADDGVASGEGNVGSAATTALDGQSVVAPSAPAARSQQQQLAPLRPPRSAHGHEGGGDTGADGGDAGADEDDAVFLGEELRRPGYTRVFLPRRPATAGGPPAAAAAPSPDALSYRSDDEWSWRRGDSLEGGHGARADAAVSLRRGRRLLSPDREFRYSVGTYNSSVFGYGSTDIPSAMLFEDSDGAPDEDEILASRRGCVTSGASVRPYHSSHLSMRSGPMGLWKRRWCVLRGDTFMWFRTKQDSLKAGWLLKLQGGGGGGGAARAPGARGAVWKRRWFVLRRDALLCYDSDKQQRPRGVLEILKAKYECGFLALSVCPVRLSVRAIVDNPESENGIDVVLPERVHHLRADSPEESSEWFSVLSRVHSASLAELREMRNELANPDNAVETLDVGMIDAVCASENPERACRFSVLSGGRMLRFSAESPREALTWMSLLQRSKGDARVQGQEFVVRGWLYMEVASPSARQHSSRRRSMRLRGATAAATGSAPAPAAGDAAALKRRWVVLTESSLDVYRTSERGAAKISSFLLTGQCTVTQPSLQQGQQQQRQQQQQQRAHVRQQDSAGYWLVSVHGSSLVYRLYTGLLTEASRWAGAIHTVVLARPPGTTPTLRLLRHIEAVSGDAVAVEQTYARNPILRHSRHALCSPLLPLPHGDSGLRRPGGSSPDSIQDAAVHMFNIVRGLGALDDPLPAYQAVLRACLAQRPLQDEAYCQLVKQTALGGREAAADAATTGELRRCWELLACASCSIRPSPPVLRYVRFHLKRARDRHGDAAVARCAGFALDALRRTRGRDCAAPSLEELRAVAAGAEMSVTVHCQGGGRCRVSVTSHTTAAEVVDKLLSGLAMEDTRNVFALFAQRGADEGRAIEGHTLVADVLASFDSTGTGSSPPGSGDGADGSSGGEEVVPWRLCFRIYCFLDPDRVAPDSVEFVFMFEHAHESAVQGSLPLRDAALWQLAALRLQYEHGDLQAGPQGALPDALHPANVHAVYPVGRLRARLAAQRPWAARAEEASAGADASSRGPGSSVASSASSLVSGERRPQGLLGSAVRRSLLRSLLRRSKPPDAGSCPDGSITSSFSGVVGPCGPGGEELAALPEALAAARAGIASAWLRLQGVGQEQAMVRYMALCVEGGFPHELWLGVGARALNVYCRGDAVPIETIPYEHVLAFGSPEAGVYRVATRSRTLAFRTAQVVEIAKLMKVYVARLVRRHHVQRSLCSSQGSWSSACP
ncbi:unnamed protein product [Lampetra fluviatilis]